MKVSVVNLGCKVNRVESDTIAAAYLQNGYSLCDIADADTIIVNTCTVTEEADKKTRKTIRRVLRENIHAKVLVTGCAAVIEPEFYESLDARITVVDKHELLDQSVHGIEHLEEHPLLRIGSQFPTRVGVKVQDGCNHSCTYCIVHIARGKAWSRSPEHIRNEIYLLAKQGVKEVVLSGIDLGSYSYLDTSGKQNKRITLAGLLRLILKDLDLAGLQETRLRISSIEPRSISKDFISLLAESQGRICRHLHLPLQSGSSRVLKEMNRPYNAQNYFDLVQLLQTHVGDLSLTTDVIVGFPGESEKDFEETCALVEKVGFTKVHVFRYSKRQGTPAAIREDQIEPQVKEHRAHYLISIADKLRKAYALRHSDRFERVVVEQLGWGMSESYYKMHIDPSIPVGCVIEAPLAHCIDLGLENR